MEKLQRCKNFTATERLMFVDILKPFASALDGYAEISKHNMWIQITKNYNERAKTGQREESHLRNLFVALKKQFRRDLVSFKGDLNQMFNHPGIDPSRKLMNKKLYDLCGQGLLDGSRNLNSSMVLLSNDNLVDSETSSDEESGDSSQDTNSQPLQLTASIDIKEEPVNEPKTDEEVEPRIQIANVSSLTNQEELPAATSPKLIRVIPTLGRFNIPEQKRVLYTRTATGFIPVQPNKTTIIPSHQNETGNAPKRITINKRTLVEQPDDFNNEPKNIIFNKRMRVEEPDDFENEPKRIILNKQTRVEEPDDFDDEKQIKLDILKIQKEKEEIERDVMLLIKQKKEIVLEKEKLRLEKRKLQFEVYKNRLKMDLDMK